MAGGIVETVAEHVELQRVHEIRPSPMALPVGSCCQRTLAEIR